MGHEKEDSQAVKTMARSRKKKKVDEAKELEKKELEKKIGGDKWDGSWSLTCEHSGGKRTCIEKEKA